MKLKGSTPLLLMNVMKGERGAKIHCLPLMSPFPDMVHIIRFFLLGTRGSCLSLTTRNTQACHLVQRFIHIQGVIKRNIINNLPPSIYSYTRNVNLFILLCSITEQLICLPLFSSPSPHVMFSLLPPLQMRDESIWVSNVFHISTLQFPSKSPRIKDNITSYEE